MIFMIVDIKKVQPVDMIDLMIGPESHTIRGI